MKTLIITVGTRQVGWHCRDGVVRSFGADGVKYDPPHTTELYRDELGIDRGNHQDDDSDRLYPWSVWDLGQRLYQHCQHTRFNNVELLLDQVILANYLPQGLSHVILWGTQQPDTVSWNYRRMDTAWLAELMAGKINEMDLGLQVNVFRPTVGAVDAEAIRDELEQRILPFALGTRQPDDDEFTLLIENKGATPTIAEGLSICAGALVRDCQVVTVNPIEPRPLYPKISETVQAVASAQTYRPVNLSSYFWPLERERILSAWKRGDFAEAKVWLSAHRDRYQALHDLAGHLALATNWQWQDTLKALQGINWIDHAATKQRASKALRSQWRTAITAQYKTNETSESKFLKLWESRLLVYLNLNRQNDTAAFMQTVQILERLLFWRYQTEHWIEQGYLIPREGERATWGNDYPASFGELIRAWGNMIDIPETDPFYKSLLWANRKRNGIVHDNQSVTHQELTQFVGLADDTPALSIYKATEQKLQKFCPPDRPMPERSLLQDLYGWGIEQLQA